MFAAAVPSLRALAGMGATGRPGPAFPACPGATRQAELSRRHGMVPCPRPGRDVFPGLSLRLPVRGPAPGSFSSPRPGSRPPAVPGQDDITDLKSQEQDDETKDNWTPSYPFPPAGSLAPAGGHEPCPRIRAGLGPRRRHRGHVRPGGRSAAYLPAPEAGLPLPHPRAGAGGRRTGGPCAGRRGACGTFRARECPQPAVRPGGRASCQLAQPGGPGRRGRW